MDDHSEDNLQRLLESLVHLFVSALTEHVFRIDHVQHDRENVDRPHNILPSLALSLPSLLVFLGHLLRLLDRRLCNLRRTC